MRKFILIIILVAVLCAAAYFLLFSGTGSNAASLKDDAVGIEVKYPSDVFVATTTSAYVPPDFEKAYQGPALIHAAPYEHCDLSGLPGNCAPTTKDLSIGFFKVKKSYPGMRDALKATFGNLVQSISFGGREGMMIRTGAEGEGTFYYLLPLTDSATLVITRSYLDESIVSKYQGAKGFIPYIDQEKTFNEVLQTLTFQSK